MTAQFARATHIAGRSAPPVHNAPHAALLIDFDNVTMGIRSDLTKELKNLLNSDIIKGKVAVQRAYADWRRYPQYIVPLAENSVDLIFAPAYGTSKKNATDIRLSIDALELVFTRPEIGTFILLSGDSDFSSLVLKLKEYGKYVIGVGIRESASDLLVQNCDEYYSYSALTGLTRTGEEEVTPLDPWECAEIAVQRMAENNDVMRSDRLKQVMLELDPNFDEKALGFTKFNRFLQEAATRGLIALKKLENGQFEVAPSDGERVETEGEAAAEAPATAEPSQHSRRARRARERGERGEREAERVAQETTSQTQQPIAEARAEPAAPPPAPIPDVTPPSVNGLSAAYELLRRATKDVTEGKGAARDSDVKRRILELQPSWTEASIGFSKFSRFLRQAHDAEVINLRKLENGNYELTLPGMATTNSGAVAGAGAVAEPERGPRDAERGRGRKRGRERGHDRKRDRDDRTEREVKGPAPAAPDPRPEAAPATASATTPAVKPTPAPGSVQGALYRRRRGGPVPSGPPPLLEGQTVGPVRSAPAPAEPAAKVDAFDMIKRLTALKGVGQKTAQAAVQAFGPGVLDIVRNDPERVLNELGARRAQPLLDAVAGEASSRAPRKAPRKGARKRARPKSAAKK
jgi:uncharacterized LabA/DUF88 family protein